MIGFLIFITTIALIPHYFLFVPFLYLLLKNYKKIFLSPVDLKKLDINIIILFSIGILSFINLVIHIGQLDSSDSVFPYTFLMFISYFLAKYISKADLKILIIFLSLEAFLGIVEFALNINTIFLWESYFTKYNPTDLLYFRKVFGLSDNSSFFAEKIFIAILLIDFYKFFSKKTRAIMLLLFFIATVISFQRTTVLLIVLFYLIKLSLYTIHQLRQIKLSISLKKIASNFILSVFVIALIILLLSKSSTIFTQLSKGMDRIELSGREKIWNHYLSFIKENLIFGNFSQKYYIDDRDKRELVHAHNSFLQVLASHGIIIFMLFISLIFININSKNFIYVSIILILSLFQYAVFWGVSFIDIALFIFFVKIPGKED